MARVVIFVSLIASFTLWASDAAILTPTNTLFNSIPSLQTNHLVESLNFCNHCVCGINQNQRIINGEVTSFDEFSWAVQIKYKNEHHCGASLITPRHIITAAHCIDGFDQKLFSVHLADNATYTIKHFTMHQDYNYHTDNNDIAIIELAKPVPLGGLVKTVCLPNKSTFKYYGMTGVAIGWGRLGFNEPVSEQLRKVDLPIMSKIECSRSQYPKNRLTDNMFCAGYLDGRRDSCRGDSGGALHVRNDDGAMEVVGLVSFGEGCAKPNYPGVYTKVTNYLEWIGRQLNNECLCSSPQSGYVVAVVSANRDLYNGYRQQGDHLIEQRIVQKRGWPFLIVDETVTISSDSESKITLVEVIDLMKNKNSAKPKITAGGHGQSYVSINLESAKGHGIHYMIKVYGKV